jgi:hypothetical protein
MMILLSHTLQQRGRSVIILTLALFSLYSGIVNAADWKPVEDPELLRELFSDTLLETTLKDGVKAEASYNADGTGELRAWGDIFARTWEIKGNNQICISTEREVKCFSMEQSTDQADTYRATNSTSGEQVVITITRSEGKVVIGNTPDSKSSTSTAGGGAAKPSADEIAASLANPNTPLASLNLKIQYRQFQGDLPGADDESGIGLIFQPGLPFPLDSGAKILFRPAIPLQIDQPVFDAASGEFDSESGIGDIGYDLAYAPKAEPGQMLAYGIVGSIPTATEDSLGSDRWTLGPEILIGKVTKNYLLGALATHQWDVAGSGDADISLTSFNLFYVFLPGGGWNVGTAPTMSYDHENDEATIPINLNAGKTVILNGRPWKIGAEINYFVDAPDALAHDWFIGFNISPIVENGLINWFK